MKYTIEGFNQEYAATLRKDVEVSGKIVVKKVDCIDLVILRWFVDFYPNMKKMEIDGKQYALLTYSKLQKDLPLIDITKRAFAERLQKMVDFDILTYRLVKEGGTFSLYGFGANYKYLVENIGGAVQTTGGVSVEQHRGCCSNNIGGAVQTHNKDYSIINYSIKDKSIDNNIKEKNTKKKSQPQLSDIGAEFESLWKNYPNKKGKTLAFNSYQKARLNGTTFDEVIRGLENYIKEIEIKKTQPQYIKHGSTWFNQHCWNDDYQTEKPTNETDEFFKTLGDIFNEGA